MIAPQGTSNPMQKAKPEVQRLHAGARLLHEAEPEHVLLPWVQGAHLRWPGGDGALTCP